MTAALLKNWAIKLSLTILAIFAPAGPMVLTVGALCIVDLVTGILAARKRGEAITSAGIGRTVSKLLVYEGAVLLAFLTQQYLTGPAVPCAQIVASLVGLTELTSCLENINELSGKDLLKSIIKKISSKNE
jgi:hypothetical protein